MKLLKLLFPKLFCNHEYTEIKSTKFIQCGQKYSYSECDKCKKVKFNKK